MPRQMPGCATRAHAGKGGGCTVSTRWCKLRRLEMLPLQTADKVGSDFKHPPPPCIVFLTCVWLTTVVGMPPAAASLVASACPFAAAAAAASPSGFASLLLLLLASSPPLRCAALRSAGHTAHSTTQHVTWALTVMIHTHDSPSVAAACAAVVH